jgi:hypothetical protein
MADENLRVVSRRGMTKQHFTQSINLNPKGCRPANQDRFIFRVKLLRYPTNGRSKRFGDGVGFHPSHPRKQLPLPVAMDELYGNIKAQQALERFPRHRPWNYVPTDDNMVYFRLANVVEDRLQCGEVPVNIIQRRDPLHRHSFLSGGRRNLQTGF